MAVNIVIFASGNGSNAENLVTSFKNEPGIRVKAIFCNNPGAYVIERAQRLSLPCILFDRGTFKTPDFLNELKKFHTDFIILAGFLWKIPHYLIEHFPDRIINIHPALLPGYGGKGMYGVFVHQSVIANKEKETGISIHLVNGNYDEGRIIFQHSIPIPAEITPEELADKIHALEYQFFPKVVLEYIRENP